MLLKLDQSRLRGLEGLITILTIDKHVLALYFMLDSSSKLLDCIPTRHYFLRTLLVQLLGL